MDRWFVVGPMFISSHNLRYQSHRLFETIVVTVEWLGLPFVLDMHCPVFRLSKGNVCMRMQLSVRN